MNNINNDTELTSSIHLSSISTSTELSSLIKPNKQKSKDDIEHNTISIPSPPKRNYGYLIVLKYKNDNPYIVVSPCFPVLFIFNLMFPFFYFYYLFKTINIFLYLLGIGVALFQIATFTIASIMNPGLPLTEYDKILYEDKSNEYRQCKDCKMWICTLEGTQHCKICNVCIEGYDHHCNLMGTCVGKNNLKVFYLYVLGCFLMVGYFVIGFLSHK